MLGYLRLILPIIRLKMEHTKYRFSATELEILVTNQ